MIQFPPPMEEILAKAKSARELVTQINAWLEELASSPAATPGARTDEARWLAFPLPIAFPVTGLFGEARDLNGQRWTHEGIDWAAPEGTSVLACAAGTVVWASDRLGYGLCVRIRHHAGETWYTWYAHLSQILVAVDDQVEAGALIGRSGKTGNSTGPHLHLTLQRDADASVLPGLGPSLHGCVNPDQHLIWPAGG